MKQAGLRAFPDHQVVEHIVLDDDDRYAANTESEPDRVTPRSVDAAEPDADAVQVALPPISWNVIRLRSGNG